jgi:hypothetical protein
MGLVNLFSRLDRWAGRFNDWFGATQSQQTSGQTVRDDGQQQQTQPPS